MSSTPLAAHGVEPSPRSGRELGDTHREAESPHTGRSRGMERFRHSHISLSNTSLCLLQILGETQAYQEKIFSFLHTNSSSAGLTSSNNVPGASVSLAPTTTTSLALQADFSGPRLSPVLSYPKKHPKRPQRVSEPHPLHVSPQAPYLDCGGRGGDLNHLGQEIFGKWELRQSSDGSVVVCHLDGTPSSARWKRRTVGYAKSHSVLRPTSLQVCD